MLSGQGPDTMLGASSEGTFELQASQEGNLPGQGDVSAVPGGVRWEPAHAPVLPSAFRLALCSRGLKQRKRLITVPQ